MFGIKLEMSKDDLSVVPPLRFATGNVLLTSNGKRKSRFYLFCGKVKDAKSKPGRGQWRRYHSF